MEIIGNYLVYFAIISTILILQVLTLIQTNKSYLENLGYSHNLVRFAKKYNLIRNVIILIYIVGVIFLTDYLINNLSLAVTLQLEIVIYITLAFFLILPAPLIDRAVWDNYLNQYIISEKLEINIDFKYSALKLIFSPLIQLIITTIVFLYAAIILKPFFMIYIHLALPWLFYSSLKNKKFLSNKHFKQAYIWVFVGINVNYLFVLYYLISGTLLKLSSISIFSLTIGIVSYCLIIGFIIYNIFNLKEFRRLSNSR